MRENAAAGIPVKGVNDRSLLKKLTEDHWAVLLSAVLIFSVLTFALMNPGFRFTTPVFKWDTVSDLRDKVISVGNLRLLALIWLVFAALASVAIVLSGGHARRFLSGFSLIYVLGIASLVIAGNKTINYYGIEYVVFALVMGLLISNLIGLPLWLKEAARSEFFIKTGLIILGTSIIFTDILQAGLPGMLQALAVVAVVWFFAMWLCKKLKVDDEFAVILASAVSICGVSAAIVACGAIQGDRKKLSYISTLVLLVAIPMMILQPWIITRFGIPEVVGGAWLGGTLDTTASVTAASELVGPVATKAGVIVKFSQNVLIGFAAFFIAAWWLVRKKPADNSAITPVSKDTGLQVSKDDSLRHAKDPSPQLSRDNSLQPPKTGLAVIWERFPKFVLGFIAASLIFSFLIPAGTGKQVSGILNSLRTVWFALAFVAIGLEARFGEMVRMQGGRPALAFIGAQIFNVIWTLILAWLLFGGILLPVPDIR